MRTLWTTAVVGAMLLASVRVGPARAEAPSANVSVQDPFLQAVAPVQTERQKQIASDTAKLVKLATELKTDMDKTSKNEMSLDVIRKADEIEKLAHDLKLRMKG
jgi:hypothetical protein